MPFNAPFAEQLDVLRAKLQLPSEQWDDIYNQMHDRAVIIAGAQSADLVNDLHQAIVERASDGRGLNAFRQDFNAIVAKQGWTGWTGEGTPEGVAWRTKVIYQTNMATSYAAGRYQQLSDPGLQALLPYWQYKHNDAALHPRPEHQSWDGLTLPPDDPFWNKRFPPCGWGCGCYVNPVSQAKFLLATTQGRGVAAAPPADSSIGIDPGFGYPPGANVKTPLANMIEQKLVNLHGQIGAAMWQALKPRLQAEVKTLWQSWLSDTGSAPARMAHVLPPNVVGELAARGIDLDSAATQLSRDDWQRALASSPELPGGLPLDDWTNLPDLLEAAPLHFDAEGQRLIYALDAGGLPVHLNAAKGEGNLIKPGSLVAPDGLANYPSLTGVP